ncbi:hypothetical protein LCGC14_2181280 [marine sediment metagenome]|uniref:Uncharacterized protein n=1 Tax=marine sediment metagenome TaxID=412755 RepID=A0A0F9GI54_9ZZZZ
MFQVEVNGDTYQVKFKHYRKEPVIGTDCFIIREDGGWLGVGEVNLYYTDTFSKNVGRKKSLVKALQNAKFSKEDRIKFWNAYFIKRNGKW